MAVAAGSGLSDGDRPADAPIRSDVALAARYALGALVAAAVALRRRRDAGCGCSGSPWRSRWSRSNYALLGPAGFQKRDGRLAPAATVLLAPYLAGAFANARAWTRGHPLPVHVADDVWIGRLPTRRDLERGAFAAIVDLTCELPLDPGTRAYVNIPVLDLTLPDRATIDAAVQAIERRRPTGRVLVCCALGYSRSATVVAAWLVATGRAADAAPQWRASAKPGPRS